MSDSDVKAFLREHPKLLGALFGMTVLLSQTGAVAANGQTISGI
jgi:hypothetical protein